jgi:D-lactate dehydrogenase
MAALDAAHARLADHLAESLGPDAVSRRAIDRLGHAHDASHYLLVPQVVVTPCDTDQVARVLRACDRAGLPLTFRSGGTSLSGQGLSDSVLVDTRKQFQDLQVLDDGRRVAVQPGVTIGRVNTHLARYRRKLGPDPASEIACTVGGVVANNSSGMHCGTEFNTYRTLDSMVLVLPTGTVIDSADPSASRHLAEAEPALHDGLLRLRRRILGDPDSVATIRRQFSMKNTMGYGLNSFLDHEDPLDILVHLMIGSEGTLGFVAEARFRTIEVLPHVATGLLVFDDVETATSSVPQLIEAGTVTAELLDAASLRVSARDPKCPDVIRNLEVGGKAAVLVEFQGHTADELADTRHTAEPMLSDLPLAAPQSLTTDAAERGALWRIRKGLFSAVAGARPSGTNALLEDVVVPVERLGVTCRELARLFDAHDYEESVIFGHARDGNVHFMLNERFDDPAQLERYEAFTHDMVDLVLREGGSLKAEHGTGRIMAPFVRRQYGDELYAVMWELKRLVDPRGLLNPGSVLSDDDRSYLHDLKLTATVEEEVDRCVECGYCEPVCPSRALTTTPRQRIVLRREMEAARLRGDNELLAHLERDYDYDAVQTCAVDGMCQTACPVQINTGDLVRRLRHEQSSPTRNAAWRAAARGWGVATVAGGGALSLAKAVPAAVPTGLTRAARAVLGDDDVPMYDERLPASGRRRQRLDPPRPEAVLFAACIGTMFGPEPPECDSAAEALAVLCHRAGVQVRTPDGIDGLCCGTPWKSKGQLDGYAVMRERVVPALRSATDSGRLPVVCDASSCTHGLQGMLADGVEGLGHEVVDSVVFAAQRLLPRLTVTSPIETIVLHPTCSSTEMGTTQAMELVARFISPKVVVPNDWGCCGFAGDRGLLHPELTASATAPEAAELARSRAGGPDATVMGDPEAPGGDGPPGAGHPAYASSNRTCEIGMTRATGKPYRHILQLLEEATR